MPDLAPLPCLDCDGDGEIAFPVCYGGIGHAGHSCGGRVCGHRTQPCDACEGSGTVACDLCGARPAVGHDREDAAVCASCALRAVCMRCRVELRPGVEGAETSHGICQPCEVGATQEADDYFAQAVEVGAVHGPMGATAGAVRPSHSAGA